MRDPEYLSELRTSLCNFIEDEDTNIQLEPALVDHLQDFRSLFQSRPRDAEARKKIETGKTTIDGADYSINKEFIDAVLRLSDHLDINEMLASEYIFMGSENAVRFDREPFQCALYIYHACRSILLDTFRALMTYSTEATLLSDTQGKLRQFMCDVVSKEASHFPEQCLSFMASIRRQLQEMEESVRRGDLLGVNMIPTDRAVIARYLNDEHQSLALCLIQWSHLRPDSSAHLANIVEILKGCEVWTNHVSDQISVVSRSIQILALVDDMQHALVPVDIEAIGKVLRSLVQSVGVHLTDQWRCIPICSTIQVILATELIGLCKEYDDLAAQFDYEQELLVMARQAVDRNVFQNMITFNLFVRNEVSTFHPFGLFFSSDALSHFRVSGYNFSVESISAVVDDLLRSFVQSFIMHMADLLKEMHLKAEDSLLVQEISETVLSDDQDHQEDLFLGLIFTAFDREEDSGQIFWEDKESDMYGFLSWASQAQIPSTIYSYFQMMSAISKGRTCSLAAVHFFDQNKEESGGLQSNGPSPTVSWSFIFDSLRYYVRQLNRRQDPGNFGDPVEIDHHNALILGSYLKSIDSIIRGISDPQLISTIQSKFDMSTVLFQLLACRLPVELYASTISLVSAFAMCSELRTSLWQMLEGWLSTFDFDSQSAVLSSTIRRKQLEHRPLSSLGLISDLFPEITVSLINLLTSLITSDGAVVGSLPFPETLGDNSRYHGIADYVTFVFDVLSSAQTDESINVLQRLDLTLACTKFMVQALSTLNLDLIFLIRSGYSSIDEDIPASSLNCYLHLHAGTHVLLRLEEHTAREAVLAIIKSHDAADYAVKERLIPAITCALDICCMALERSETFNEFVRPLLSNQTPDARAFAHRVAADTELFIHVCLLANSDDDLCSAKSLDFILAFGEFRNQYADRVHLAALTSVDQSKIILSGFIALMEQRQDSSDNKKLALMRFVAADLELSAQKESGPSVAHFLLGFSIGTNYELTSGSDLGELGSGRSLLHTLLDSMASMYSNGSFAQSEATLQLHAITARIVFLLCDNPVTSQIVMPLLREDNYFVRHMTGLKVLCPGTQSRTAENDLSGSINRDLESAVQQRTDLFRYCSKELLVCKSTQAESLLQRYFNFLITSKHDSSRYDVLLLDYLDMLRLNTDVSLPGFAGPQPKLDVFSNLLLDMSSRGIRRAQLALDLMLKSRLSSTETNKHAAAKAEHERLFSYLVQVIETRKLRLAISTCLQEWNSLTLVMFDMLESLQHKSCFSIASNVSHRLLIDLSDLQASNSDLADILSGTIAGTVHATHHSNTNAELSLQFFRRVIMTLETPYNTQIQRAHLYFVAATCLQTMFKDEPSQPDLISKTGSDRLLSVIFQDIADSGDLLKISASILLDFLLQTCETQIKPWLSDSIVRLNLADRFLHHFESSLRASADTEFLGRLMDISLRLAMTRAGAREITHKSGLLTVLAQKYLIFEDGKDDATFACKLLRIYVACSVALGLQNNRQFLRSFARAWHEKLSEHARRMTKSDNRDAVEFKALLDVIQELLAEADASNQVI